MSQNDHRSVAKMFTRIKRWVEHSTRLLQSQSSLELLSDPEVEKVLWSLVAAFQLPAFPELVAATAQAAALLLRMAEDLAGRIAELVNLLQLQFAATAAFGGEYFLDLGDLVVRCGELSAEAVLDGVLGHLMYLLEAQVARVPWLGTLLRLLRQRGADGRLPPGLR